MAPNLPPAHDDELVQRIIKTNEDNVSGDDILLVFHHYAPNYDKAEWDWLHNQLESRPVKSFRLSRDLKSFKLY